MFSFLSASHSISPHLAPENYEDLAFFLVNGFLRAAPWFSSTVTADLMGYYSCSKTGNKNCEALKASVWKDSDMFEAEMRRRRRKWEMWEHVHFCVLLSYSEAHWFQWRIELTGLPVSPAERAAAAGEGHLVVFGFVRLVFWRIRFNWKSLTRRIQQRAAALALRPAHETKVLVGKATKPLLLAVAFSCACAECAMKPIFISVTFGLSSSVWTGICGGCPKVFISAALKKLGSNSWSCKTDYAAVGEIERPEVPRELHSWHTVSRC